MVLYFWSSYKENQKQFPYQTEQLPIVWLLYKVNNTFLNSLKTIFYDFHAMQLFISTDMYA